MPTGNSFTSAQAPDLMQAIAPDLATQQMQLARRQQLADMLRQQAFAPDQGTQVINGWAVKKSPWEGVSKMAQALMGGYMQSDVDAKQLALSKALQERRDDILNGNRAGAALSQGAVTQPSTPDDTGEMVNQGGVGPTVQNAARMNALSQSAPNNFTMGNLLRGQIIQDIGGQAAGSAYWDQFKPTEGMKTDSYLGITPAQSRASELAKRLKEGYIAPTRLGEGAYADSNGNVQGLPTAAPPGYINVRGADGQWTTAPVSGGVGAVQESEKAKKLGQLLGTLGEGVDAENNPTYFLGLPPGTVGAPSTSQNPSASAPAPVPQRGAAPGSKIDLTHMTPQESEQVMAEARRIGYLRPGSKPGTSIEGSGTSAIPTSAPTGGSSGVIRPRTEPGQSDFMTTQANAAGKRINDLVSTAADSPTRVNVLDNIINLSKGGVDTGPNAGWVNGFKGVMASVPGFSGWKDDATGFQELKKYMNQNGLRAWQAAGGSGTDSQLSAAMAANPNDKMFPKAVQTMAQWAKAGELALQGKANAAQNAGVNTPQDQTKFETAWRQNMDPRIYQLKLMEPAEAQTFVANLKKTNPSDYQALMKKAQNLKQMGGL